jgi:putative hydrolase of the HAD superfamily
MNQQPKIKAVLFDIDGVILEKNPFSKRLSQEFNVPMEKISPFFQKEFKLCSVGKADLKEEIKKYLADWNWQESVNEILAFWFDGEGVIDERIIKTVNDLREKGIKCYLVSDQEKYRAEFLLNELGLGKFFDGHFISCQVGFSKSDDKFFQNVIGNISPIVPQEIMFWDDDKKNIEPAKKLGIDARFYQNFDEFKKEINKIL